MIAAITGANGFIGRHLVRRFDEAGWETRPVVRRDLDSDGVERLFAGADVVVHAAGATRAPTHTQLRASNIGLTRRVIEAARRGTGAPPDIHLVAGRGGARGVARAADDRRASAGSARSVRAEQTRGGATGGGSDGSRSGDRATGGRLWTGRPRFPHDVSAGAIRRRVASRATATTGSRSCTSTISRRASSRRRRARRSIGRTYFLGERRARAVAAALSRRGGMRAAHAGGRPRDAEIRSFDLPPSSATSRRALRVSGVA